MALSTAVLAIALAAATPVPRTTPSPRATPAKKTHAVSDALIQAMRPLPEHARPLYAIGDVDEDGVVDARDRVFIKELAKIRPDQLAQVAGATCPAAADLDLDGTIGASDLALADEWLAGGGIATPALFYTPVLPCRFERPIVAGQTEARQGEDFPLWILAPGVVKEDVDVKVEEGPAKLGTSTDPRTIVLAISSDAKKPAADTLVVRIAFRGGRSYLLSVPIAAR